MSNRHDLWVEVDRCSLQHNFNTISEYVGSDVGVIAVVKANGYGHGLIEAADVFEKAGAAAVAVTRIDEGIALRESGISSRILLLAPIQPDCAEDAVGFDLECTVSSPELLKSISNAAVKLSKQAAIHIKIDTGMGRIGVFPDSALEFCTSAAKSPGIRVAGIYTHFATAAEKDISFCKDQIDTFESVLKSLRAAEIDFGLPHAANSAAMLRLPRSRYDLVRPGTLLYGQYPSAFVPKEIGLKPTWKLLARICEVKNLPAGHCVGYGCEFVCKKPTKAAVVPVGWADGYTLAPEGPIYRKGILELAARKLKRQPTMKVSSLSAPVIGRVAMQMTILDVSEVPNVSVGDIVEVPALRIPTSSLIPRVYVGSDSES